MLQYSLPTKSCQNEKLPKNVQKMSQNAFWDFLAASQKNVQKVSGKCPGAGAGAGKMSRKCQKSVPQTFSRHFFDTFWQIENQKGARARSARAPFWVAAEGRHLYLPKNNFLTTFLQLFGQFFAPRSC